MIPMNDLRRGYANSEESFLALKECVESGYWIQGTEHKGFEKEFASFLEVKHVLGVASGTDALEIALRAVGCERGSKIITVANAGGYTAIAAASIGCEVIFCDVDSDKLLMDPERLASLLSEEIAAVVVTHLFGNVAPVKKIREMCDLHGIKVIEDCAQAAGACEFGLRVGTVGHVGTFSFYPTKNLGAIGDGGALATNDSKVGQRIRELRQYGWTTKYKIDVPGGVNSRLDEVQAAVLRIGLRKLDDMNKKRIEIIKQYSDAIQATNLKMITSYKNGNVGHLAVLRVPNEIGRDEFRSYMNKLEIQTDVHYPILDCDQVGLGLSKSPNLLNNSRASVGEIVSIPLFPELTNSEVQEISASLRYFKT